MHYGDVRVGVIVERVGNPDSTHGWQWGCGFYPGSHLAERASGIAENFDQARGAFEPAWRVFLANRTEADFEEYVPRLEEAMWAAGLQLPTQAADGRAMCFCGAAIGLNDMDAHVYAVHMEG